MCAMRLEAAPREVLMGIVRGGVREGEGKGKVEKEKEKWKRKREGVALGSGERGGERERGWELGLAWRLGLNVICELCSGGLRACLGFGGNMSVSALRDRWGSVRERYS